MVVSFFLESYVVLGVSYFALCCTAHYLFYTYLETLFSSTGSLRTKTLPHTFSNRIVGTIHATWMTILTFAYFIPDHGLFPFEVYTAKDMALTRLANRVVYLMLGYLVYDSLVEIVLLNAQTKLTLLHHTLGVVTWAPVLLFDQACPWVMWTHLAEFSTPFINLGWFMHNNGAADWMVAVTALSTVLVFFIFRVVSPPLCAYSMWNYKTLVQPFGLWAYLFAIQLFFVGLNCYWFSKLVGMILNKIMGAKKKKTT